MNTFDPLSFSLGVLLAAIVFFVVWILSDIPKLRRSGRTLTPPLLNPDLTVAVRQHTEDKR